VQRGTLGIGRFRLMSFTPPMLCIKTWVAARFARVARQPPASSADRRRIALRLFAVRIRGAQHVEDRQRNLAGRHGDQWRPILAGRLDLLHRLAVAPVE
jgi:hypothetical protein